MISPRKWLHRLTVGSGIEEAKQQVEKSKEQRAEAEQLSAEVNWRHQENRISQRVHQAFKGGRA